MGVLRPPCYSASCRTYAGGPRNNRIIWYYVSDDTPFYEELHAYSPGRDEMYTPADEPEKTGLVPNPRKYYSGLDLFHHDVHGVHGDIDDFLCLSPLEKFSPHGEMPDDPCNESLTLWPEHGIRIGGRIHDLPSFSFKGGVRLGAEVLDLVESPYASGILIGGKLHDIIPLIEEKKRGVKLGGKVNDLSPFPEKKKAGIFIGGKIADPFQAPLAAGVRYGGTIKEVPVPIEVLYSGLLAGGHYKDFPPTPAEMKSGLKFGGKYHDVGTTPTESKSGLKLGGKYHDVTITPAELKSGMKLGGKNHDAGTVTELKSGLKLGSVIHDVGGGPPVPGTACSSAGVLTLGSGVTATCNAASHPHWWRFPVTTGTHYTVTSVIHAGAPTTLMVLEGSCPSPTFLGFVSVGGGSFSFTASANDNAYVEIDIHLPTGSCNYTLTATSP